MHVHHRSKILWHDAPLLTSVQLLEITLKAFGLILRNTDGDADFVMCTHTHNSRAHFSTLTFLLLNIDRNTAKIFFTPPNFGYRLLHYLKILAKS